MFVVWFLMITSLMRGAEGQRGRERQRKRGGKREGERRGIMSVSSQTFVV